MTVAKVPRRDLTTSRQDLVKYSIHKEVLQLIASTIKNSSVRGVFYITIILKII